MENRKKFSTGSWSSDNLQSRFNHVCAILSISKHLDRQELDFIIKNAFISKVYVSCGVVKAYPHPLSSFGKRAGQLYSQLVQDGILNLRDKLPSKLNGIYMDICELGTKVNPLVPKNDLTKRIHIEHVVPGKVYIDDVIKLYQKNAFKFEEFEKIFNAVSICLVTEAEDDILNAVRESDGKGIKYRMPYDTNGIPIDYTTNQFARYQRAGIKIWKQCDQPCPGVTNCPQIITP